MNAPPTAILFIGLSLALTTSCDSPQEKTLASFPARSPASGAVALPKAAPWSTAQVWSGLTHHSRMASGRNLPVSTTMWRLSHAIELTGKARDKAIVPLFTHGSHPAEHFDMDLLKTAYTLRPNDAGTCIAWSGTKDTWALVLLDSKDGALHCPHLTTKAKDPCAQAPSFEALLLDILHGGTEKASAAHPMRPDRNELTAAARIIAARPSDDPIHTTLAKAMLLPFGTLNTDFVDDDVLHPLQRAVRDNKHLRDLYTTALTPELAWHLPAANAAECLELANDEATQIALARIVNLPSKFRYKLATPEGNFQRRTMRSLARITETRQTAPKPVIDALLEGLNPPKRTGNHHILLAIRALSILDTPETRAALQRRADKAPKDKSPPAWPESFDGFSEAALTAPAKQDVNLWARAALERR